MNRGEGSLGPDDQGPKVLHSELHMPVQPLDPEESSE